MTTRRIVSPSPRALPAAFTTMALAFGVPALANAGEATGVTVQYSKAALKTEAGAAQLYASIERAAARACGDVDARNLVVSRVVAECRDEAVARAVAAVGAPMLASIHAKHGDDTRYASAGSLRTSR